MTKFKEDEFYTFDNFISATIDKKVADRFASDNKFPILLVFNVVCKPLFDLR